MLALLGKAIVDKEAEPPHEIQQQVYSSCLSTLTSSMWRTLTAMENLNQGQANSALDCARNVSREAPIQGWKSRLLVMMR